MNDCPSPVLGDLSESQVLARLRPSWTHTDAVVVGPGDDAAVLACPGAAVVATTDSMVRGTDWRDDWSSGHDVGVKLTVSNIADLAAMGATPTGLLVSLMADPAVPLSWVVQVSEGIGRVAREVGAAVLGGDLSSAPPGVVVLSMTALGDLAGREPVLRSGARPGDVVAVCGTLGHSGAGLELYADEASGRASVRPDHHDLDRPALAQARAALQAAHRAPSTPWRAGPAAAEAGVHALIDISDGLVRDAGRIAMASGVRIDLSADRLRDLVVPGPLGLVVGARRALALALSSGEEHSLLGCFDAGTDIAALPGQRWHVVGAVRQADGDRRDDARSTDVLLDGAAVGDDGWDHFAR